MDLSSQIHFPPGGLDGNLHCFQGCLCKRRADARLQAGPGRGAQPRRAGAEGWEGALGCATGVPLPRAWSGAAGPPDKQRLTMRGRAGFHGGAGGQKP